MGNRLSEQIADAAGVVVWRGTRSVNNLNRLAADTLGGTQARSFAYDANGERVAQTDALNQTTRLTRDALRRVTTLTNPANATASRSYDALDAVTQAKDFLGIATDYARDAQGNATTETSPDTGTRATQYDALGLPSRLVDALGQATAIVRDALGRPTRLTHADGKTITLRYDLAGAAYNHNAAGTPTASVGYLSEVQDRAGTTVYQRDVFGRVTRETRVLVNGMLHATATTYTAAGLIDTLTYPGGADHLLRHTYDATGRLARLDWRGQALLTNIAWTPLGQPSGWTWAGAASPGAKSIATTRTYDTAGRLTQVGVAGQAVLSYQYDAPGRVSSLSQMLASPVNAADPNSAVTGALRTWRAGYDTVGRLTSFNPSGTVPAAAGTANTASFTYDANGNRTASTQVLGALSTSRAFRTSANRVMGFTQTTQTTQTASGTPAVSATVAYAYNANGDLLNDGSRRYAYDATGRLSSTTTGATNTSATTRYAHDSLGQRVFKTEPVYAGAQLADGSPALAAFFAKGWTPASVPAEMLGFAYVYGEDGQLLGEFGSGGAKSSGTRQYVWLETPAGPLPVAMVKDSVAYAVTADHLYTPRRVSAADGSLLWQWPYSAFGEELPNVAASQNSPVITLQSGYCA